MPTEFETDTAVSRASDDTFTATITDRWNTFVGPNGGYVLAIAARALSEFLPKPDPISVTGHFLRPPSAGPVEIRLSPLKEGQRHATALAHVVQEDRSLLAVLGTFGGDIDTRSGPTLELGKPPELPSPADAIDPLVSFPREGLPSIARRVETRLGALPGWIKGTPSGDPSIDTWIRFVDGSTADPIALVALPDFVVPTVFDIGELVSATVELTVHVRARPRTEWLAMRVRTRHVIGGYHEEDVEIWDADGALVAQARQLALLGS